MGEHWLNRIGIEFGAFVIAVLIASFTDTGGRRAGDGGAAPQPVPAPSGPAGGAGPGRPRRSWPGEQQGGQGRYGKHGKPATVKAHAPSFGGGSSASGPMVTVVARVSGYFANTADSSSTVIAGDGVQVGRRRADIRGGRPNRCRRRTAARGAARWKARSASGSCSWPAPVPRP